MSTNTTSADDPKICEPGGSGLFVPLFGSDEGNWSKVPRAFIYGIFMCYCFLGASVVSDYFMAAIESITGKKMRVYDKEKEKVVTYYLWNDTVANLTLLALGSSAPEILLSIVEVLKLEFKSGELGPSTIVGSAAFNLLCIIAVCIVAIPQGSVRFIKGVRVYHVTVFFALFAYLWLLLIVAITSKDVVTVEEGILTLVFFFMLVVVAFAFDKYEGRCEDRAKAARAKLAREEAEKKERDAEADMAETVTTAKKRMRNLLNPHLKLIKQHRQQLLSKAHANMSTRTSQRLTISRGSCGVVGHGIAGLPRTIGAVIAKSPPAGDNGNHILVDADVDLEGNKPILNKNGVLTFMTDCLEVKGCPTDTLVSIPVLRRNGTKGTVTCKYHTERLGAVPEYDYQDSKGTLIFQSGSVMEEIQISILPQRLCERSESFQLVLDEIDGGAEFNPHDDGKDDCCIMTITIVNGIDDDMVSPGCGNRCYESFIDPELLAYGLDLWKEQISDALSAEGEDGEPPAFAELAMHWIALPWKLVFAVSSPPPVFLGGWVLFFVALCFIGFLTALVADLAENFGCCVGLENAITAIIVVAPGTSLPDLFASQSAAVADDHADASIVNVTGSNSVNVFLGIGLPWTLCAIYWRAKGAISSEDWALRHPDRISDYTNGAFVVEAGTLAFSVVLFTCVSVIALAILRMKRVLQGGELGGDSLWSKQGVAALFVVLWVWYLGWNIGKSSSDDADIGQWISIGLAVVAIVAVIFVESGAKSGLLPNKNPSGEAIPTDPDTDNPSTPFMAAPLEAVTENTAENDLPEQPNITGTAVGKMLSGNSKEPPFAPNSSEDNNVVKQKSLTPPSPKPKAKKKSKASNAKGGNKSNSSPGSPPSKD